MITTALAFLLISSSANSAEPSHKTKAAAEPAVRPAPEATDLPVEHASGTWPPVSTLMPEGNAKEIFDRWELTPADKTLKLAIARWATKAGWQLQWELPVDYALEVEAVIPGTFEEAVEAVTNNMQQVEFPIKTVFYKGNKVLRIMAKGEQ